MLHNTVYLCDFGFSVGFLAYRLNTFYFPKNQAVINKSKNRKSCAKAMFNLQTTGIAKKNNKNRHSKIRVSHACF